MRAVRVVKGRKSKSGAWMLCGVVALKARDPEMHQTRKGQQWYFGMKMHIGVDSRTGLAHSAVVTPANVHDKHPLPQLLHGNEWRAYSDSAYASQKALMASKVPRAKDFTNQRVRKSGQIDEAERSKNRNKSKIRARVEHVFAVVKQLWGFTKVRYRGLAKSATRSLVANSTWRERASWHECARDAPTVGTRCTCRAKSAPIRLETVPLSHHAQRPSAAGLWLDEISDLFSVALNLSARQRSSASF